jgi:hypothetical protein
VCVVYTSDESFVMIYALAISVAFSTLALVTLGLVELARSLLHRAQMQRGKTLNMALRLRAELSKKLDRLRESDKRLGQSPSPRGRTGSGFELHRFKLDCVDDQHAQSVQSLRDRLTSITVELDEPEGREVERLCQLLSDLATEVELLAVEMDAQAVIQRSEHGYLPAGRLKGSDRRAA